MADFQYSANLTVKQILDALNQVDKTNQKVWQRAEKDANRAIKGIIADHKRLQTLTSKLDKSLAGNANAFKSIGQSAQASGVQIGAVAGIVAGLTNKFIELGIKAVQALSQGIKQSVNLATELETTEAIFTGIFQGNEDAAVGALARIREESRALGVDLGETARAFLPFVESLDQLTKVGKISAALAISQPEQGALGARVALQEFLAGSSLSLVKRFEIPKNLGKELNEAIATGGVEEGLEKLDEILTRMGRNIDNLGDTAQLSFGKARISAEQLQAAFGQPILDELKAQFDELNTIVSENFDDYTLIADVFGRILASVVDIIGSGLTDFLAGLDTEQVIEIGETFFDIVENARTFASILSDTDVPTALLDGIQSIAEGLETALDTAIKLAGIVKAQAAQEAGKAAALEGLGLPARSAGVPTELLLSQEQKDLVEAAGEKAFRDSILETSKAIEESTNRKEENRQATDDLRDSLKQGTEAGEGEADAFLAAAEAARKLADAQEAAKEAQDKINEATAKIETDFQRDLLQADIKFERARTDALLDGQRKREDAARKNLQKIVDIEKKNKQAIADSGVDLNRDIEDIATKHARESIEQRKDEAQKIIDLETDTRRKIADIIEKSQIDLDEAESRRDAVSFLRILKQRNQEISAAQQDTSRAIQDTRIEGQRKRDELKLQQEQEIQDARLANERRLEDLKTSLDRELEAQAVAFAREREEIAINEQQKLDDLAMARERDREDAQRNRDEKLADLQVSMAEELAIIQAGNAALEAEAARHAAAMAAAEAQARTQSQAEADDDTPDSRPGQQNRRRQRSGQPSSRPGFLNRFQHGGAFTVGGLGGPDSQLVQFMATPGERVMISPRTPANNVNNFNNQRAISVNQNMLDPSQQSAIMRAIARQEALDLINGLD